MKKREKNSIFNKFQKAAFLGAATVAIVSSVAAPTFAQEAPEQTTTEQAAQEQTQFVAPIIVEGTGVDSNNDNERRAALEAKLKFTLDKSDVWADKKGQIAQNPDGTTSEYTSHQTMKDLGFYAVNANRQELIQYAIRTGDWQPYRAFEAEKAPAYFEIVDGKYEYSKVYYGKMLESMVMNYNSDIATASIAQDHEKVKEIEAEKQKFLNEYVPKFNEAPGFTPYVVHVNHNESVAKETGAVMYSDGYFDSKYNHPDVMDKGIFVKEDKPVEAPTETSTEDSVEVTTDAPKEA